MRNLLIGISRTAASVDCFFRPAIKTLSPEFETRDVSLSLGHELVRVLLMKNTSTNARMDKTIRQACITVAMTT